MKFNMSDIAKSIKKEFKDNNMSRRIVMIKIIDIFVKLGLACLGYGLIFIEGLIIPDIYRANHGLYPISLLISLALALAAYYVRRIK